MRAYITIDGEIWAEYDIGPDDSLEADHYARRYANECDGRTVEQCCNKDKHYVPCDGDFTVTVAEETYGAFGAVCWQSRNYFFDSVEVG
jgi:hypothetical protein